MHHEIAPSPWVRRFVETFPTGRRVLDVACGSGRHTRFLLAHGHPVTSVDRDISGLADMRDRDDLTLIQADLENGQHVPFTGRHFAGVVVTNYLYRPIIPDILAAVAPGGVLIYETFALGNEAFGRPANPNHLLRPGELLEAVRGSFRVHAYEDLVVDTPRRAAVQRIFAERHAR